ncbi:MAG: hypothetical protein JWN71_2357 [Xanthobacteraceae bacterium]|nr:hypothetical protein [Xanthobacteraceae bacterium]
MNKLMTVVALATTVISAPAFAQTPPKYHHDSAPAQYQQPSDVVTFGGKVVGQDPDVNVRENLLRDAFAGGH